MRLGRLLLDACNLQLHLSASPQEHLRLTSADADDLHKLLSRLTHTAMSDIQRHLQHEPATSLLDTPKPSETLLATTAVFDGRAWDGAWASMQSDPYSTDEYGNPLHVVFTDTTSSADDLLYDMARSDAAGREPAAALSGAEAEKLFAAGGPVVVAATRNRSLAGRAQRERREAFLRNCGLPRIGDNAHLPGLNEAQRSRSLGLIKGLRKLGPEAVSFIHVADPATLVVSDDRGLRRRCMKLPSPPLVLGRAQFFNWLYSLEADGTEEVKP